MQDTRARSSFAYSRTFVQTFKEMFPEWEDALYELNQNLLGLGSMIEQALEADMTPFEGNIDLVMIDEMRRRLNLLLKMWELEYARSCEELGITS